MQLVAIRRCLICTAIALFLFVSGGSAQTRDSELRIYLLTFGPGDAVWEKFGHNAILVEDPVGGQSTVYNWGMFSFSEPGYVRRLIKGRLMYWMEGRSLEETIYQYQYFNRSIWAQELNLTPPQRVAMRDFLIWNARGENKFYRYDYFRDNCSTRVRDAIDRATGGALARALISVDANSTYRSHTQALTYDDVPTYAGLMMAMGHNIDAPLNAWEETFIPMELREWVRRVEIRAPDGTTQPLVLAERTVFEAKREPLAAEAPNRVLLFTVIGVLIAALIVALARLARTNRKALVALAIVLAVLSFAIGFFGLLITLLWTFTDHVVTYRNENVLQANPISLAIAVLAPLALLATTWARRWAVWLALFMAGCSTLGFVVQIMPGFIQHNGEIIGLLMPVHGAIAYVLWRNWRHNLTELNSARRAAP